jgi:hypothetical protein
MSEETTLPDDEGLQFPELTDESVSERLMRLRPLVFDYLLSELLRCVNSSQGKTTRKIRN